MLESTRQAATKKWYADGLRFECTQCGNCCSGPPGNVWTDQRERRKIAAFLNMEEEEFTTTFTRRVGLRYSLKEKQNGGDLDCIFLVSENGKRVCSIYPVRPLQCRTWPFWKENLKSPEAWAEAGRMCPGINQGPKHDFVQIEIQRTRRSAP